MDSALSFPLPPTHSQPPTTPPTRTGIFKFRLSLPPAYNDVGTRPAVHFVGPVPFHPMVHPEASRPSVRPQLEWRCRESCSIETKDSRTHKQQVKWRRWLDVWTGCVCVSALFITACGWVYNTCECFVGLWQPPLDFVNAISFHL